MKTDVLMPQMGESIAEGTVARWLKKVGDRVDRDEPLLEISTDKVDAEIPSPAAGVLTLIHVAEGGTAAVNSVVAVIQDDAGDTVGATPASPSHAPTQAGPGEEKGSPRASADARSQSQGPASVGADIVPGPASAGPKASPVARSIARAHHVDLAALAPGVARITKADILRHLSGGAAAAVRATHGSPLPATASPLRDEIVPMTVMRRKIAEHMIASRQVSAHVHSVFVVDCARVEQVRQARKAEAAAAGVKLSILPFVVKAAAVALQQWPLLNASLDGDRIVYHGDINIGIAVALDTGLIVPVISRADRRSLLDIARAIGDLATRARTKQLRPEEVTGGTFTVTNPGNFGGTFATPIINQPQVAILELGTVEKRVVVVSDTFAIRPMMHLTLGFDHRLVDGVVADQYLAAVKQILETWV